MATISLKFDEGTWGRRLAEIDGDDLSESQSRDGSHEVRLGDSSSERCGRL